MSLFSIFNVVDVSAEQHPTVISNGVYKIRNMHSQLYLEAASQGTASGTNVVQWYNTSYDSQKWRIIQLSNGDYVIRPYYATAMALDVYNNYTSNGSNVDIWYVGTANDPNSIGTYAQWKFVRSNEGGYIILSKCSNYTKSLVVQNASKSGGANVFQWQFNDDGCHNDMWVLEPVSWNGNSYTNWTSNSPVSAGDMWFDVYNSSYKTFKSTVNFTFSQNDINTIKNEKTNNSRYWGFDVTSHRNDNSYRSDLSAYAVLTNLPNPKVDVEDDYLIPFIDEDGDDNYEESEAICLSPESLSANTGYNMITYWVDRRNGGYGGYITATSELSKKGPSDYNHDFTYYDNNLNYGKDCGSQ
jgi:hypothetical protein